MNPEDVSTVIAKESHERALAALLRRRPDLRSRARGGVPVPVEERAQVHLDQLAYTTEVLARMQEDVTALVVAARTEGASWAKIGLALRESAQTAFNRYRRFDPTPGQASRPAGSTSKRSRTTQGSGRRVSKASSRTRRSSA